jgi:hypothetical protein
VPLDVTGDESRRTPGDRRMQGDGCSLYGYLLAATNSGRKAVTVSMEDLQAELIALRLLVTRQLRAEFDARNRDPAWHSALKVELLQTISLLRPRDDPLYSQIKAKGLDVIDESLLGPRPPSK